MGCEDCKELEPVNYNKCQKLRRKHRSFTSPCGTDIGKYYADFPKFTPKKKKRKKK